MACVKKPKKQYGKKKFQPGDWALTRKKIKCQAGYFEKGTKVRIAAISVSGYDLEDGHGNRINDTGFHSIVPL